MASRRSRSHHRLLTVEKDKDVDETKMILNMKVKAKPEDSFSLPTSVIELKTKMQEIVQTLEKLHEEEMTTQDTSTSTDGKGQQIAEMMQGLHRDLEVYQYIYSRLSRLKSIEVQLENMLSLLTSVRFLRGGCDYLVNYCRKAMQAMADKTKAMKFAVGKGKTLYMKDFVTLDHLLLLNEYFEQASSLLHLCSKESTTWKTFIFENPSEGITSPFSNVLRKIRALLSTVGAEDDDLDLNSPEYRKLESSYQTDLLEAVSSFLGNPTEVLTSELLYRLSEDINTLKKGKDRTSSKALSVTEELLRLLDWMHSREGLVKESIAEEVEKVKQEWEEREKEEGQDPKQKQSYTSEAPPSPRHSLSDMSYNQVHWSTLHIVQEVGAGAFALVYEAELAGERVAVKKIKDEVKDAKTQLYNEVRILSQLRSSYVVDLYGASFRPSQTIMVMEYLPRGSIFDVLNNAEERISWKMRWKFAVEMAAGLNYIHTRRPPIVHRDLKTGNFLLSQGWRVKLCDFGLAIPIYPPPPPMNCGTVRWTAPEINDCLVYTTKSDVYSYGIILWEIAAREIPWKEESNDSTIKRVARGDRPDVPAGTPISYQMLMSECWAQQPEHRPSFSSILHRLRHWGVVEWVESLQGEDNFEKIKIENAKLEAKAERQSKYRADLESRQNAADAKIRQLQRQKRELKIEKDEAERKHRELAQRTGALDRLITANKTKLAEVEKSIRAAEAKAAENRETIEEERREASSKIKSELDEVRKKTEEEEGEIKALQERKKALEEEKASLTRKLNSSSPAGERAVSPSPGLLRP